MDARNHLLTLAERCESSTKPNRELDADIYEALGFTVRRKPTRLATRRTPAGGIYQRGGFWKALGAVSGDIDVAVSLLRERAPDLSWSLQCLVNQDSLAFQALVAECSGQGVMGSLALCAAMLRALARNKAPTGVSGLDAPGIDHEKPALTET